MKTMLALLALLTIPGLAAAGATVHVGASTPAGDHTVDIAIDDAGNASVLVDGQPVGAPSAPGLPSAPGVPDVPSVPDLPSPGVPSLPALPTLP
jgi:hypothetical protein